MMVKNIRNKYCMLENKKNKFFLYDNDMRIKENCKCRENLEFEIERDIWMKKIYCLNKSGNQVKKIKYMIEKKNILLE